MNHSRTIAALAIAAATATTPALAQEQQGPPPATTAKPIGKVELQGKKTATLRVRYTCKSGSTLWISLKQSKKADKDKALTKEGSSKAASAWLQSHRNPITCDGAKHSAVFTVDKVEPGSKGKLKEGKAWLQFCITEGETLTLSKAAWVDVK
jgi:curli biogenesis system outer membrane secretion channel CsgG